jgi:hypothetical protein
MTDSQHQLTWNEVKKRAVALVVDNRASDGIEIVNDFLAKDPDSRLKAEALAFRGDLKQDA